MNIWEWITLINLAIIAVSLCVACVYQWLALRELRAINRHRRRK